MAASLYLRRGWRQKLPENLTSLQLGKSGARSSAVVWAQNRHPLEAPSQGVLGIGAEHSRREEAQAPAAPLLHPGDDQMRLQRLPAPSFTQGISWIQEAVLSGGPFSRSNILFEEMCLLGNRPF